MHQQEVLHNTVDSLPTVRSRRRTDQWLDVCSERNDSRCCRSAPSLCATRGDFAAYACSTRERLMPRAEQCVVGSRTASSIESCVSVRSPYQLNKPPSPVQRSTTSWADDPCEDAVSQFAFVFSQDCQLMHEQPPGISSWVKPTSQAVSVKRIPRTPVRSFSPRPVFKS